MNRRLLLAPAALMAAWFAYGTVRWVGDGASVVGSWRAATADWMAAVFLSDGMAFGAVCLVAVLLDLRRRGARPLALAGWTLGILVMGAAALLTYLALREPSERVSP